jgi:hypothetical protein
MIDEIVRHIFPLSAEIFSGGLMAAVLLSNSITGSDAFVKE